MGTGWFPVPFFTLSQLKQTRDPGTEVVSCLTASIMTLVYFLDKMKRRRKLTRLTEVFPSSFSSLWTNCNRRRETLGRRYCLHSLETEELISVFQFGPSICHMRRLSSVDFLKKRLEFKVDLSSRWLQLSWRLRDLEYLRRDLATFFVLKILRLRLGARDLRFTIKTFWGTERSVYVDWSTIYEARPGRFYVANIWGPIRGEGAGSTPSLQSPHHQQQRLGIMEETLRKGVFHS